MRTPITVINGYLDYLEKSIERETLTSEVLQATIKNITGAAGRLERYVDCVKDIQKMEDVEMKKDNCDLKELIAGITREFSALATQKNKQFNVQNLSKTAFIQTDRDMLLKIFRKMFLITHSVFSSEKIMCSIKEKEEYLYFSIQDDGVGFTSEELKICNFFLFQFCYKWWEFWYWIVYLQNPLRKTWWGYMFR